MLAKFLKRKESRHVIQQPQSQEVPEKSAEKNGIQNHQITTQPLVQYRYQRPDLLGKVKQFTYIHIKEIFTGKVLAKCFS